MNETFDFSIDYNNTSLNIHVDMNYPFYDISINGENTAQIRQDHHSNWFITTGALEDDLLQLIGRRIVLEITGQ